MYRKITILLFLAVILVSTTACNAVPQPDAPAQDGVLPEGTAQPEVIPPSPPDQSSDAQLPRVTVPGAPAASGDSAGGSLPQQPTQNPNPVVLAPSQGGAYTIVDTGQSKTYGGTSEIAAPSPGEAFYGQDAQYSGNQPSYTTSGDGLTVLDNVTGLTWTQGADWSGDGIVNADDKFTYAAARTYADTLNARNYGGYSDWRVPTIKQLYSLIDYRGTDPNPSAGSASGQVPFIDAGTFQFAYGDTAAGERIIDSQWATSTLYVGTVMGNTQAMFGVNFADGRIKGYPAVGGARGVDKTYYVRFCRGNTGYGTNSFTDSGDGTVADSATGLMWSQTDSGEGMDWEAALAWVQQRNAENYLGYDDWRLPNAKELQSLLDYTRSPDTTNSAAIDPLFEVSAITNEAGEKDYPFFWSGTNFLRSDGSAARAVYLAFGRGLGSMDSINVIDVHGAGCQRSDPKDGDPNDFPNWGFGPQGDVQRVFNYVRCVRSDSSSGSQSSGSVSTNGDAAQEGLTLFAPISGTTAYLIDMDGKPVHQWQLSGTPGNAVYLLEGGELLATYTVSSSSFGRGVGGSGGGIEILDWAGDQIWSYQLSDATYYQHHDVEYLPGGNILAIAWEKVSASEALGAGMDSSYVNSYGEIWSEAIFEIDPNTDSIVWEWHAWDHLLPDGASPADHPELIDPNYPTRRQSADWLHINSVDYNVALDQIMLSVHNTNEIWLIDHATTTLEAAGPRGDLLYRWGNPAAFGESGTQVLFAQHDAEWVDPEAATSSVIIFNNGNPRSRPYSNVLELETYPYSYGAARIVWEYGSASEDETFFSSRISGVQRLENGNTLICSGAEAWFFEVTSEGKKVWEYTNPYGTSLPNGGYGTDVFRAERYAYDFVPGYAGQ